MKSTAALAVYCLLVILLIPQTARSQQTQDLFPAERVISGIDEAYQAGEITYSQSLQQKFYAAFDSGRLSPRFDPGSRLLPLRCALPLISEFRQNIDRLDAAARDELEIYTENGCSRPETDKSHPSRSGRFIFHYTLEGENAVPAEDSDSSGTPDYIERAAFAADSSWNHLIGTLGFEDPILMRSVTPYEVYFKDFGGIYGRACPDGLTSYFIVHSNFRGFPPNEHPEGDITGAMYVTVAHEFKHASQYATNRWQGPEERTISWIEMDAVMIENIVFPDVNDYYNYIRKDPDSAEPTLGSIFNNPEIPIPRPLPTAYSHATWMLYFAEKYGMEFWVDVWDRLGVNIDDPPVLPFLEAVGESLTSINTEFEQEHIENLTWHLASGPSFAGPGFGFQQREAYPDAAIRVNSRVLPDSSTEAESLDPLAGHFLQSAPHGARVGNAKVTVNHERSGAGFGLIGYFQDGSVEFDIEFGQSRQSVIETDWRWDRLDKIGIAVVNADTLHSNSYTWKIESVMTEQVVLFQNYPNPFRETTRIQFTVDAAERVRLEIYDILGRQVRTVADRFYDQGLHSVDVDAADLASGVYIYRLMVGGRSFSKKMMHVR